MPRTLSFTAFVLLAAATAAHASPNVSLDDPRYEQLASLYARGIIGPHLGGLRPLTEARMNDLIGGAGEPPKSWWVRPIGRALLHLIAARDLERPYSTSRRPRDLIGLIAASCAHTEGRPCGPGAGLLAELDSSVGYQDWISATMRLREVVGSNAYDAGISIDRAYVSATVGPFAAQLGRDVIAIGPSARTSLGWGDNAPPLDHVRLSTAKPFELTSTVKGSIIYILGRLRDPQTFPGNLVSIGRGQLDLGKDVEIGMMQMLQLAGENAAPIGFVDFVLEHLRRRQVEAGPMDSSNRRIGFDVSIRSPSFRDARFYYQLVFEDWRDRFHDALRHDADHLLGVELAALGPHALVVELQKTGVRSQEHTQRVTGFTNGGRVVGSPLGPDTQSLYAGGRLSLGRMMLAPWLEFARLSSDSYMFVHKGPISHTARGPSELRLRGGAQLRRPVGRDLSIEAEAWFEHVERFESEPGVRRENLGVTLSAIWRPELTLH